MATRRRWTGVLGPRTAAVPLLAVLLLPGGLAGCGSSGSGDGAPAAASAPATTAAPSTAASSTPDRARWEACLRQHGVPMPTTTVAPSVTAGPAELQAAERAQAACTAYGPPATRVLAQAQVFVRCMRQHGVNLPDPYISSSRVMMFGSPDTSSAQYRQAVAACGRLVNQDVWPSSTS